MQTEAGSPRQLSPSHPGPTRHQAVKYCHRGPSSAFSGSQRGSRAGACRSGLLGSEQAGVRRAPTQGRHSPNDTEGIRNATSRCNGLAPSPSAGARAFHVTEDRAEHSPRLAGPASPPRLPSKGCATAPLPPAVRGFTRGDRVSLLCQLCGDLGRTDELILTSVHHPL